MGTTGRDAVFEIAGQRGAATRAQLIAAGWTYSAISHALSTRWAQPAPGVFLSHRGAVTAQQAPVIGALWAGQNAVLTAAAALHIYGALSDPPSISTFVGSWRARSRTCGVARRVRSRYPPSVAHQRGAVAVASPARALVDFARWDAAEPTDVEATTIACLQQKVTTPVLLAAALEEAGRPHMGAVRLGLREFVDGAWSRPEATLRRLMRTVDLPAFVSNHALVDALGSTIGTPDAYFPRCGVAVQVHSKAHHSGWDSDGNELWARTVERDNRYAACGVTVIGVTPRTLARAPDGFMRQLICALEHRRKLAPPLIVMRCPQACNASH